MKNSTPATKSELALRRDFVRCFIHANPTFSEEKTNLIYDLMEKKFPEFTRPSHRGAMKRLAPWETIAHTCPANCGCVVTGIEAIVEAFGLRKVNGKMYLQSWCPGCKNSKTKSKEDPTYGLRVNAANIEVAFTN